VRGPALHARVRLIHTLGDSLRRHP
jgi:hypothetical protein